MFLGTYEKIVCNLVASVVLLLDFFFQRIWIINHQLRHMLVNFRVNLDHCIAWQRLGVCDSAFVVFSSDLSSFVRI